MFYLDSKSCPTPTKRLTARKSTKSKPVTLITKPKPMATPMTEDISDDDMPLIDIRKNKTKSIDTLSMPIMRDSIIPLATDLQSLPGHCQDENRDSRFLAYSDIDTLSMHFQTCLYVDPRLSTTKSNMYKTNYNVLNKILKLYYVKTFRKKLSSEKSSYKNDNHKQQPLSVISSPTAMSFKMDWNVNRRHSSSTHRHTPKNSFHILQLNPRTQLNLSDTSSPSLSTTSKPINQTLERMKDILARTYYPLFYKSVESGYQFGSKSIFPNTQQLITTHDEFIDIKEMPESPSPMDDLTTITLKSPPSTTRRDLAPLSASSSSIATIIEQKAKRTKVDNTSLPTKTNSGPINENIDELSPWMIRKSVVVLTPTKIPSKTNSSTNAKEKDTNVSLKRKTSITTNTNVNERKKKRIILSSSSSTKEQSNQIEDISDTERYRRKNMIPDVTIFTYFLITY